jgi:hypothetical protein
LILALILGAVVFAATKVYRAVQRLSAPKVPDDWRRLATTDTHLAAALSLRDRLYRLRFGSERGDRNAVLKGVHETLAELVLLVRVRNELLDYLRSPTVADRANLEAHAARLDGTAEQARLGLEQVYAELLTNVAAEASAPDGVLGPSAVGRVQTVLEDLRLHRAAEDEVRSILSERSRV